MPDSRMMDGLTFQLPDKQTLDSRMLDSQTPDSRTPDSRTLDSQTPDSRTLEGFPPCSQNPIEPTRSRRGYWGCYGMVPGNVRRYH